MRTKKESHKSSGRSNKLTETTSHSQQGGRYLQQLQRRSSQQNKYSPKHNQPVHTPTFHRRIP